MHRPSLVAGTAVLATVLSAILAPSAAHAVDAAQSLVVSSTPTGWTPQVLDGQVNAMAAVGSDIVIGGTFTQVQNASGGTIYSRPYIAAFNATTGLVDTGFAPTLAGVSAGDVTAGHGVDALAANGSDVIVGGVFSSVNGATQRGITELTLTGARVAAFAVDLNGTNKRVYSLAVRAGRVFVGGSFDKVSGVLRSSLVVLNAVTGAVESFNVPVTGTLKVGTPPAVATLDVSPDGSRLVVGGNFTAVRGLPRNQLAIIDAVGGVPTTWQTSRLLASCADPNINTYVRQVSIAPDGSYFVLANGGGPVKDTLCDSASRWELGNVGSGQQPTWVDSTGGDTLYSVATTGTAVYVGGHQRWMNNYQGSNSAGPGAVDRKMIAALDPVTGLPVSWNPAVTRGGNGIYALMATPAGLWVGSDNQTSFGSGHDRVAFFPVAGGTSLTRVRPALLPRDVYLATSAGTLLHRAYTGSSFGAVAAVPGSSGVPWGSVTGAFMVGTSVYYGLPDGTLHKLSLNRGTFSAPVTVSSWWVMAGVKSFTFDAGRLYYVTGDGKLYYRWFSIESDLVGAEPITAAATGYTDAGEMFVASGNLYFARADHKLYRVALSAGAPTGASTAVSGPGIDGNSWTDRAAFVASDSVAVRTAPPGLPTDPSQVGRHQPQPPA